MHNPKTAILALLIVGILAVGLAHVKGVKISTTPPSITYNITLQINVACEDICAINTDYARLNNSWAWAAGKQFVLVVRDLEKKVTELTDVRVEATANSTGFVKFQIKAPKDHVNKHTNWTVALLVKLHDHYFLLFENWYRNATFAQVVANLTGHYYTVLPNGTIVKRDYYISRNYILLESQPTTDHVVNKWWYYYTVLPNGTIVNYAILPDGTIVNYAVLPNRTVVNYAIFPNGTRKPYTTLPNGTIAYAQLPDVTIMNRTLLGLDDYVQLPKDTIVNYAILPNGTFMYTIFPNGTRQPYLPNGTIVNLSTIVYFALPNGTRVNITRDGTIEKTRQLPKDTIVNYAILPNGTIRAILPNGTIVNYTGTIVYFALPKDTAVNITIFPNHTIAYYIVLRTKNTFVNYEIFPDGTRKQYELPNGTIVNLGNYSNFAFNMSFSGTIVNIVRPNGTRMPPYAILPDGTIAVKDYYRIDYTNATPHGRIPVGYYGPWGAFTEVNGALQFANFTSAALHQFYLAVATARERYNLTLSQTLYIGGSPVHTWTYKPFKDWDNGTVFGPITYLGTYVTKLGGAGQNVSSFLSSSAVSYNFTVTLFYDGTSQRLIISTDDIFTTVPLYNAAPNSTKFYVIKTLNYTRGYYGPAAPVNATYRQLVIWPLPVSTLRVEGLFDVKGNPVLSPQHFEFTIQEKIGERYITISSKSGAWNVKKFLKELYGTADPDELDEKRLQGKKRDDFIKAALSAYTRVNLSWISGVLKFTNDKASLSSLDLKPKLSVWYKLSDDARIPVLRIPLNATAPVDFEANLTVSVLPVQIPLWERDGQPLPNGRPFRGHEKMTVELFGPGVTISKELSSQEAVVKSYGLYLLALPLYEFDEGVVGAHRVLLSHFNASGYLPLPALYATLVNSSGKYYFRYLDTSQLADDTIGGFLNAYDISVGTGPYTYKFRIYYDLENGDRALAGTANVIAKYPNVTSNGFMVETQKAVADVLRADYGPYSSKPYTDAYAVQSKLHGLQADWLALYKLQHAIHIAVYFRKVYLRLLDFCGNAPSTASGIINLIISYNGLKITQRQSMSEEFSAPIPIAVDEYGKPKSLTATAYVTLDYFGYKLYGAADNTEVPKGPVPIKINLTEAKEEVYLPITPQTFQVLAAVDDGQRGYLGYPLAGFVVSVRSEAGEVMSKAISNASGYVFFDALPLNANFTLVVRTLNSTEDKDWVYTPKQDYYNNSYASYAKWLGFSPDDKVYTLGTRGSTDAGLVVNKTIIMLTSKCGAPITVEAPVYDPVFRIFDKTGKHLLSSQFVTPGPYPGAAPSMLVNVTFVIVDESSPYKEASRRVGDERVASTDFRLVGMTGMRPIFGDLAAKYLDIAKSKAKCPTPPEDIDVSYVAAAFAYAAMASWLADSSTDSYSAVFKLRSAQPKGDAPSICDLTPSAAGTYDIARLFLPNMTLHVRVWYMGYLVYDGNVTLERPIVNITTEVVPVNVTALTKSLRLPVDSYAGFTLANGYFGLAFKKKYGYNFTGVDSLKSLVSPYGFAVGKLEQLLVDPLGDGASGQYNIKVEDKYYGKIIDAKSGADIVYLPNLAVLRNATIAKYLYTVNMTEGKGVEHMAGLNVLLTTKDASIRTYGQFERDTFYKLLAFVRPNITYANVTVGVANGETVSYRMIANLTPAPEWNKYGGFGMPVTYVVKAGQTALLPAWMINATAVGSNIPRIWIIAAGSDQALGTDAPRMRKAGDIVGYDFFNRKYLVVNYLPDIWTKSSGEFSNGTGKIAGLGFPIGGTSAFAIARYVNASVWNVTALYPNKTTLELPTTALDRLTVYNDAPFPILVSGVVVKYGGKSHEIRAQSLVYVSADQQVSVELDGYGFGRSYAVNTSYLWSPYVYAPNYTYAIAAYYGGIVDTLEYFKDAIYKQADRTLSDVAREQLKEALAEIDRLLGNYTRLVEVFDLRPLTSGEVPMNVLYASHAEEVKEEDWSYTFNVLEYTGETQSKTENTTGTWSVFVVNSSDYDFKYNFSFPTLMLEIVDWNGRPLANQTIVLYDKEGKARIVVHTDNFGRSAYELPALKEYVVVYVSWFNGYLLSKLTDNPAYLIWIYQEDITGDVQHLGGERTLKIRTYVYPATLTVKANGRPLAGVRVQFYDQATGGAMFYFDDVTSSSGAVSPWDRLISSYSTGPLSQLPTTNFASRVLYPYVNGSAAAPASNKSIWVVVATNTHSIQRGGDEASKSYNFESTIDLLTQLPITQPVGVSGYFVMSTPQGDIVIPFKTATVAGTSYLVTTQPISASISYPLTMRVEAVHVGDAVIELAEPFEASFTTTTLPPSLDLASLNLLAPVTVKAVDGFGKLRTDWPVTISMGDRTIVSGGGQVTAHLPLSQYADSYNITVATTVKRPTGVVVINTTTFAVAGPATYVVKVPSAVILASVVDGFGTALADVPVRIADAASGTGSIDVEVLAGTYTVAAQAYGYTWSESVSVSPGQTATVQVVVPTAKINAQVINQARGAQGPWTVQIVGPSGVVASGSGSASAVVLASDNASTPLSYTVVASTPFGEFSVGPFTLKRGEIAAKTIVVPTAILQISAVDDNGYPINSLVSQVDVYYANGTLYKSFAAAPAEVEVLGGQQYTIKVIAQQGHIGTYSIAPPAGQTVAVRVAVPGTAGIQIGGVRIPISQLVLWLVLIIVIVIIVAILLMEYSNWRRRRLMQILAPPK